ncbi:MAG: YdcF family protein [Crocinitomicaceae bacterium]|nr:YdcF family protein [Crocinitomicaceae bacterium]
MKFILSLLVLSAILSSCAFSKKKSQTYFDAAQTNAPYDVIIVPGVPHDGVSWSPTMNIRVSWSDYLYKNGMTNNIIYSGGAVYTKYSEAKIMAEYGRSLGIPASNIFLDTNAEHSSENVYYSYLIAKKLGFKKIALATDPFQAKSLKGMIKKLGLPIDLLPVLFDTIQTMDRTEPIITPEITIEDPFISIKDRESFFTRFKGTMGKQIMWYEEDLPDERTVQKFRKKGRLMEASINTIDTQANLPLLIGTWRADKLIREGSDDVIFSPNDNSQDTEFRTDHLKIFRDTDTSYWSADIDENVLYFYETPAAYSANLPSGNWRILKLKKKILKLEDISSHNIVIFRRRE